MRGCTRVIEECVGVRPVGWAGPGNLHTAETLGILADEGYRWFGDAFDDDVPYVAEVNGKRIAVIPKLNYANDWRAWSGGLGNATTYFEGFKTSFDFIYQEALRGRAGAMDVIVHAELGGRPNIAVALRADDPLREAVSGRGLDPAAARARRLSAVVLEPAGGAVPAAGLNDVL